MKAEVLQALKEVDFYPDNLVDGYTTVNKEIKTNFGYIDIEVKWYVDLFYSLASHTPLDDDYAIEFIDITEFTVYDNYGDEIDTDITFVELKNVVR